MSRNWIPALVAIGVGVFSGYYTFQPLLKDLQMEKAGSQRLQLRERPDGAQTPTTNNKDSSNAPDSAQSGNPK